MTVVNIDYEERDSTGAFEAAIIRAWGEALVKPSIVTFWEVYEIEEGKLEKGASKSSNPADSLSARGIS